MLELTGREAEQRVRRAQRGAERDELLAVLEELEWWYRDLVVARRRRRGAVVHVDRLDELRADATRERLQAAERACELVRAAWRRGRGAAALRAARARGAPRPAAPRARRSARVRRLGRRGVTLPGSKAESPPLSGGCRRAGLADDVSGACSGGARRRSSSGGGRFGRSSVHRSCRSRRRGGRARGRRHARALRAVREPDLPLLPAPARLARGGRGRGAEHVPERVPRDQARRRPRARVGVALQDRAQRLPVAPPLGVAPRAASSRRPTSTSSRS